MVARGSRSRPGSPTGRAPVDKRPQERVARRAVAQPVVVNRMKRKLTALPDRFFADVLPRDPRERIVYKEPEISLLDDDDDFSRRDQLSPQEMARRQPMPKREIDLVDTVLGCAPRPNRKRARRSGDKRRRRYVPWCKR